jgi:CRP-like cAMP-binding protein
MSSFGTIAAHPAEDDTAIRAKRGELLARVHFEKDKIIFREGHDGTDTFIVESGRIGVFKATDGKNVRLAVLEKGSMFGEMAAITGEPRSATTMALESSVVVRIPKSTMQSKLNNCDPFIKAMMAILINNLSRVNERYATTNKIAEKLLHDLKTAQIDKPLEAPAAEPETPEDIARKRGKDGAAPI